MPTSAAGVPPFGDPFPGLRPFDTEDSHKFFGRETQVDELLERLAHHRFVAVVGESGSGKSSLVRAGLIPALYRGFLRDSTSRWRFAVMRPGASPLAALASALGNASIGGADTLATLSASSAGLVEVVSAAGLERGESLLVIVDQFEELFRYAGGTGAKGDADARLFVRLLLHAVEQWPIPVYAVLTMRSDFLGHCAKFPGLPEMLNRSQYLVPLLGRDQRQDAIVRPLRLVCTTPTPALVQEVLNASSDESTTLPVLQHALARMYEDRRRTGESTATIGVDDYNRIGGIRDALARHGDELFALTGELQPMCERLFKALTVTSAGSVTRRPTSFADLQAILAAGTAVPKRQLTALVRLFAKRKHSFLTLSTPRLADTTIVDITHESLIQFWPALARWVKEEARSSEWYGDLARDVVRHRNGEVGLWRDPQLARVLETRQRNQWNSAWARQYLGGQPPTFEDSTGFLDQAVAAQNAERDAEQKREAQAKAQRRRIRELQLMLGGVGVVILIGLTVFTYGQYRALAQRTLANDQQTKTVNEALDAQKAALDEQQRASKELQNYRNALAEAQKQGMSASEAQARLQDLIQQQAQKDQELIKAREAADAAAKANTAASQDQKALLQRVAELQNSLAEAVAERQKLAQQVQDMGVVNSSGQNMNMVYQRDLEAKNKELDAKKSDVQRLTQENTELRRRLDELRPGASTSDVQAIRAVLREYGLGFPTVSNRSVARLAAVFPDYAKYDDGRLVNTLGGVDELSLVLTGDPTILLQNDNRRATADSMMIISTRLKGAKNPTQESKQAHFELERRDLNWIIVSKVLR